MELETWICRGGVKRGTSADVVVIGFQEIVPLNVGKVLAVEDSDGRTVGRPLRTTR